MQENEGEDGALSVQGLPFYTSHSMNIKDKMVHGELYKKSKSGTANFFNINKYLKRFVHVDFIRKEVTQRADYHPETKVKRIPFQDIVEINYEQFDENGKEKGVKYTFKFKITQTDTYTTLFARTKRE